MTDAQKEVSCPDDYSDGGNGICYKLFQSSVTFSEAAETCRRSGGTLAMPRDAASYHALQNPPFWRVLTAEGINIYKHWIGLGDQRSERRYEWMDGAPMGSGPWSPGEPNDKSGDEDCVESEVTLGSTNWASLNDVPCSKRRPFICQFIPGPTKPTG
ncbi:C-type lectin lectoxin-Thr1-like [Branchiostoma floridae x Branchiostoma japonicum]